MIHRLLLADWLKIRYTWAMWLVFIGPLCLLLCQVVNYRIRYDYLINYGWEGEQGLFIWVQFLLPLTIMLGGAIIASMVSAMEHDAMAFKQIFALPVSRVQMFSSKVIWVICFLGVSILFCIGFHALFGVVIGFTEPVPWKELIKLFLYPYLAALPFFSLQLWLSLVMKNQAIPIIVGVLGSMFSAALAKSEATFLHWLIWAYPNGAMSNISEHPEHWAYIGIGVSIPLLIIVAVHFSTQEVK